MNRRQFLTVLTSGVVGLSLVETQWIPGPMLSTTPLPPTLLRGLGQITPALAREVGALLNYRAQFEPRDYSLGMGGMRAWFSVGCRLAEAEWEDGVEGARIVTPMALALAERIRDTGIMRFGALPIATGDVEGVVATDKWSGVTVRGIRMYDAFGSEYPIYADDVDPDDPGDATPVSWRTTPPHWITRFDILGGPAA